MVLAEYIFAPVHTPGLRTPAEITVARLIIQVYATAMSSPHTPTSGLAASRSPRSSPSASTSNKSPQHIDSPHTADDQTGTGPTGGPVQESGAPTTSDMPAKGTRTENPAPPGGATKPSKPPKRKKNRHRKRRNRHQSFLPPGREDPHERSGTAAGAGGAARDSTAGDRPRSKDNSSFYKLGRDLSSTSLDSDVLLDHRYVDGFLRFISGYF